MLKKFRMISLDFEFKFLIISTCIESGTGAEDSICFRAFMSSFPEN